MILKKQNITGLILAGGAGRRVGGQDKGLINYQGNRLISRQVDWLSPQVAAVFISANRNVEEYRLFDCKVLQDKDNNFDGPLQGILRGLQESSTEWLFVSPVDVPDLPHNLVNMIIQNIFDGGSGKQASCYYLATEQREHYLSMLISRNCLQSLSEFTQDGNKRVRDFHRLILSQRIDLKLAESCFRNLNLLKDYK